MQHQARCSGKVNPGKGIVGRWGLIPTFYDSLERLKKIAFKPKIKVFPNSKDVLPSACDIIECPKILKEQRLAILNGIEARSVDDRTVVVREKGLIGENGVKIVSRTVNPFSKVLFHRQPSAKPRSRKMLGDTDLGGRSRHNVLF